jgi:hypothetical protein
MNVQHLKIAFPPILLFPPSFSGWLCGALQIQVYSNVSADSTSSMDKHVTILDGIGALNMSDGLPISSHWIDYLHTIVTSKSLAVEAEPVILPFFSVSHHPTVGPAKMIVVVEKETVYHRLYTSKMHINHRKGIPRYGNTCLFIIYLSGKSNPSSCRHL